MVKIAVIGSINMDVVIRVRSFPKPGESIFGEDVHFFPGGKGANQAVAAARLGALVTMVGQVGTDPFGAKLTTNLRGNAVDCSALGASEGSSGIAVITVNESGENHIVVSPGANGRMTEAHIAHALPFLSDVHTVLFQLEIPLPVVWSAIRQVKNAGCRVMLNSAPAALIPDDIYPLLDGLIMNESEAAFLSGQKENPLPRLAHRINGLSVLTLGTWGLDAILPDGTPIHMDSFPVKAVDTTAAGDAFTGALAVKLAEAPDATEESITEALRFASAVAAISVTRHGAQPSLPTREETEAFLTSQQP